jgi:uncharacterized protein YoxC
MSTLQTYQTLAKKIQQLKDDLNQKKGTLQSIRLRLKKEFGCDSVEDASKKLKVLKAKLQQDTTKLKQQTAALEKFLDENQS